MALGKHQHSDLGIQSSKSELDEHVKKIHNVLSGTPAHMPTTYIEEPKGEPDCIYVSPSNLEYEIDCLKAYLKKMLKKYK